MTLGNRFRGKEEVVGHALVPCCGVKRHLV
jgi:hypothetical protein